MPSTLCVIQARLGSSRYPNKVLADLCGKPMIAHVVERVRQIRGVDDVVLAVPYTEVGTFRETVDPSAKPMPSRLVRGYAVADDDVLARFAAVVQAYPDATTVIRMTGDCPLLDPLIAERVLALYQSDPRCQYASNICDGYVDGTDTEVFSRGVLEWAHLNATDPFDREHVTPLIRRSVWCLTLPPPSPEPKDKLSVDTLSDLERVRKILEARCLPT